MDYFIKFIKTSGIYFIGNVLIKMVTFLLLPLYTIYISPADYGEYDLYIVLITFLVNILFLDIWVSAMRFMFEYKSIEDKRKAIYSSLVIYLGSLSIYLIITTMICNLFDIKYGIFIIIYGITMCLQNVYSHIARGYSKNLLFITSGLIGTIITLVINIVLLTMFKWDYKALYVAGILGYIVQIIVIEVKLKLIRTDMYKYIDWKLVKVIFRYSAPLCVNSVAFWFLNSYSRVVISKELSSFDNGLYAVASKFAVAITLLTGCFLSAWQEVAFSKGKESSDEGFYSTAYNVYIKFLGVGLLGVLPVIHIIFPYMIGEAYYAAKDIIPTYMLATVLSVLSGFLGSIFGALKKTNIIFYTTMMGSIVNVILANILIPKVGLLGANIALFLGFLINVILRIRALHKDVKLKMELKIVLIILIGFIIESYIFINGNMLENIYCLVLALIISIIFFKEHIKMFYPLLKKKYLTK